jgi:hypothetical protein
MTDTVCKECVHSTKLVDPRMIGQDTVTCRRFPPQVLAIHEPRGVQITAMYPAVQGEMPSCGEFEQRMAIFNA